VPDAAKAANANSETNLDAIFIGRLLRKAWSLAQGF